MSESHHKLIAKIQEAHFDLPPAALFEKLKSDFEDPKLFKHKDVICFFCDPSEVLIRQESVLIAALLIDQKFRNLNEILQKVTHHLYPLPSSLKSDEFFYQHVVCCLKNLQNNLKLQKTILQFSTPLFNPWSEQIIRSSLRLSIKEKLTPAHIQTLALSAWFHPLRQNVGSCFATAPAIVIQKEQPEQFFADLEALLNVGILKRTFEGHEHAIPISTSWGPGILNKTIVFSEKTKLWESSELLFCLNQLKVIDAQKPIGEQHAILCQKLENYRAKKKGEKISLKQILEHLLQQHFKMSEKDLSQTALRILKRPAIQIDRPELTPSDSRREQYHRALKLAQYHMISFHEHPLLKTWEYTFASFAETKSEFYKWNLYVSLGFDSKKEHSLAQEIYHYLEGKLRDFEEKIKYHDQEYEQEYYHVKMLEKRVVDTESEHTANWARVEFQNHLNEFNFHRKMRDSWIDKSEALSKLLEKLLKIYDALFPKYFQEVYDASMHEVTNEIFEDSPAGFRLLYKHGRQDPSLWSYVQSKEDFIKYLEEFFVHTEFEVSAHPDVENFKQEYSEIVTRIVHLIQSDEFIRAAYSRIAQRYDLPFSTNSLSDAQTWPYQPWCYISGGTMERLLTHYYKRENQLTKLDQKVATETELMAFLIDVIRSQTPSHIHEFKQNPDKSLLMYSPTHAFLFKPGWTPLDDLWDQQEYSYTWIRDRWVVPQLKFIQSLKISPPQIHFFLDHCIDAAPYYRLWLKENIEWPSYDIALMDLRALIASCDHNRLPTEIRRSVSLELIDSWIYQSFPFVVAADLESLCLSLLEDIFKEQPQQQTAKEVLKYLLKSFQHSSFIPSNQLYEMMLLIVAIVFGQRHLNEPWPTEIRRQFRQRHLMMPKPFIFADTNWPFFNFGLTVNPATEKLSLWRFHVNGCSGFPMLQWQDWFSESKAGSWGVLTRPEEYTFGQGSQMLQL